MPSPSWLRRLDQKGAPTVMQEVWYAVSHGMKPSKPDVRKQQNKILSLVLLESDWRQPAHLVSFFSMLESIGMGSWLSPIGWRQEKNVRRNVKKFNQNRKNRTRVPRSCCWIDGAFVMNISWETPIGSRARPRNDDQSWCCTKSLNPWTRWRQRRLSSF